MALTQVDQGLLGQYAQYTGFKNRIINGAMAINQRGVTSGVTSGYFVDRWQVSGVSTTSLISSSLPNNFTQAISINRTSAAGTMTAYQPIESKNCYDLVGQSVTLSFWAQNVTGLTSISANLSYANSADSFGAVTSISTTTLSSSPSSSWTYYTATFTSLPSGVANGLQVSISGATAGTGTLGITGVQLEKGSTATSFDYRPYGTELQLCQRYYYMLANGSGQSLGTGWFYAANSGSFVVPFPVTMRSTPSIEKTTGSNYYSVEAGGYTINFTGNFTINNGSSRNVRIYENTSLSGATTGQGCWFYTNNASSFVGFSAEL